MSTTLEMIEKAHNVVSDLCKGKAEWRMSVPAKPDSDPDLVIGAALRAAKIDISAAIPAMAAMENTIADSAEWLTERDTLREEVRTKQEALDKALGLLKTSLEFVKEHYEGCLWCGADVLTDDGDANEHGCWHDKAKAILAGTSPDEKEEG